MASAGRCREGIVVELSERAWVGLSSEVRLRDLSGDEFFRRYDCDRFTATVLANRFRYVAAHVANQFRFHAFSPIIRDAADLCAMLSGPPELGFPMAAVSETLPLFYGSIPDAVRIVLEEHGLEELRPGDMLVCNDYYRVGTHLNDMCNIRPIFYQGELVGAVTIRGHLQDVGGQVMGGIEVTKRNVYQDGLRLPPILLYSGGKEVPSTFKLFYDDTRLANLIVPDLKTTYHALELGEKLLFETIQKYGLESYVGAMCYACDASAEAMGAALAALPDGTYTGEEWIDGDGLPDSPDYGVRVKITKVGGRAEFDLRGSSHASRTALNCAWPDVKTAVAMALKLLIDPKNPVTSGTLRSVDVVVPPNAIFNPEPPHACMYYWEVVMLIVHAVYQALNPILGPNAVTASTMVGGFGIPRYRTSDGAEVPLVGLGGTCWPWGATKEADGDSAQQPVFQNLNSDGGVETDEHYQCAYGFPVVDLRNEYVADTGGPGRHRGGAASARDVMYLYDAQYRFFQLDAKRAVAGGGVYGGRAGSLGAGWIWDGKHTAYGAEPRFMPLSLDDPAYQTALPQTGLIDADTNQASPQGNYVWVSDLTEASQGAVVRVITSGGGGWGDALTRDPEKVKEDVRDQYVTIEGAARDYGVVVAGDPHTDPEGLQIDQPATDALRQRLRQT
jgi:N-methylhydantoinase B